MIVDGTNFSMTRGDNETLKVKIKNRPFQTGDIITMTIRKKVKSDIALQKVVNTFDTNGVACIDFLPKDTKDMDFGKYVCDIQWTTANGIIKTIVKPETSSFTLTEEVTY